MIDRKLPDAPTGGLSLVLATLGRADELGRFFSSISKSAQVPIEVIVVDQNDDDRLVEIIASARQQGLDVNHIRVTRKGLSYARNIGLKEASYELVGFPDDDCWYNEGVCEAVCREFDSDSQLEGLVARWAEQFSGCSEKTKLLVQQQRRFSGVALASICLFFRRELIVKLGGFNEKLGVGEWFGAAEETDLVLRVLEIGHKVCFFPAIEVHHYWSGVAIDISGDKRSIYRRSKLRARGTGAIYAKHSLDAWVVTKGLLSPILRMLILRDGFRGGAYWLGTLIGRFQGFLGWKFQPRNHDQRCLAHHEAAK